MNHAESIARLRRAVLDTPGATGRAFRIAVQERATSSAAQLSTTDGGGFPSAVATYVDKIRRHAYRVTDEDVAALKAAGCTEDAIFEITVSSAVAAGLERLDRGLRLLRESRS